MSAVDQKANRWPKVHQQARLSENALRNACGLEFTAMDPCSVPKSDE